MVKVRPEMPGLKISVKGLWHQAQLKAQQAINQLSQMFENLPSQAEESERTAIEALRQTGANLIEAEAQAHTGMTVQEIKFKCNEGISAYKKWNSKRKAYSSKLKGLSKEERENEQKKEKENSKKKLDEWLKKQKNSIRDSFFVIAFKDQFEALSDIASQGFDAGSAIIEETIEKSGNLTRLLEENQENLKVKVSSAIDYSNEINSDSVLSELQKSGSKTEGEVAGDTTTGANDFLQKLVKILNALMKILALALPLIKNKEKNKAWLENKSAKRSEKELKDQANDMGMSDNGKTAVLDPETNKFKEEIYDSSGNSSVFTDIPKIGQTMVLNDGGLIYSSEGQVLPSELSRMRNLLDENSPVAKYNEKFKLISRSTKTDGAILENLKYAGNNEAELEFAINNLNNGERL